MDDFAQDDAPFFLSCLFFSLIYFRLFFLNLFAVLMLYLSSLPFYSFIFLRLDFGCYNHVLLCFYSFISSYSNSCPFSPIFSFSLFFTFFPSMFSFSFFAPSLPLSLWIFLSSFPFYPPPFLYFPPLPPFCLIIHRCKISMIFFPV